MVRGAGDTGSTAGSRTTLTLSSGKWAVVKPSSGALTTAEPGKRLVLLQLPHGAELKSLQGSKVSLPASGQGTGSVRGPGKKARPLFSVVASALPATHNARAAVTPAKRSDFPPGTRLLAPPLSASLILSVPDAAVPGAQAAEAVGSAMGSLKPAAVPQLGRLAPIPQAPSLPGYFTPPGSSGAGVQEAPAGAEPVRGGSSAVQPGSRSDGGARSGSKKPKKAKSGKKAKKAKK